MIPTVVMMVLALLLSFAYISGGETAPCSADTVSLEVTSTADLKNMTQTLNCTGGGTFEVSWMGSIQLEQAIELSEGKELTVTGSSSMMTVQSNSVMDAGSTTGIFRVYNGSTLTLNHLVLEGGNAENGAAVDARSFSSVYAVDCSFTNNNATSGGETNSTQDR